MIHGNLYIHGLATSVEFFRADFGGLPSCAKLDVVVPAETHGCKLASGADGRALLVQRGKCSFYDKMVQAQASNASLLIVANSEPGLLRMPAGKASGDMVDLHIPGIMVRNASAEVFFQLAKEGRLGHVQTHTPGEGCVPISQPAGSEPQATAEQPSPTSAVEVQLPGGVAFEGALATFGPPLPTDLRNAELVMFPDVLACTEAAPAELNELQGRLVLVLRGECPMVNKTRIVERAGGLATVIANYGSYGAAATVDLPREVTVGLVQPAGDEEALDIGIPTILVDSAAGRHLFMQVAAGVEQSRPVVTITASVGAVDAWPTLLRLEDRAAWRTGHREQLQLFVDLVQIHHPQAPRGSHARWAFVKDLVHRMAQEPGHEASARQLQEALTVTNFTALHEAFESRQQPPSALPPDSGSPLDTNVPATVLLIGGTPVGALDMHVNDAIPCTVENGLLRHRVEDYVLHSAVPAYTKARKAFHAARCLQKAALANAEVLGQYLLQMRRETASDQWERLAEKVLWGSGLPRREAVEAAAKFMDIATRLQRQRHADDSVPVRSALSG